MATPFTTPTVREEPSGHLPRSEAAGIRRHRAAAVSWASGGAAPRSSSPAVPIRERWRRRRPSASSISLTMGRPLAKPLMIEDIETALATHVRPACEMRADDIRRAIEQRRDSGPLPAEGRSAGNRRHENDRRRGAGAMVAARWRLGLSRSVHPDRARRRPHAPTDRRRCREVVRGGAKSGSTTACDLAVSINLDGDDAG